MSYTACRSPCDSSMACSRSSSHGLAQGRKMTLGAKMSRDELRLKEGSVNRRTHRRSKAGWPGDRKRGSNSRFAVPFEGGTSGSSGSPEYGGRSKARRSRQSMNKRRQGDRSNKRRQKGSFEGPATEHNQSAGQRSVHFHVAPDKF